MQGRKYASGCYVKHINSTWRMFYSLILVLILTNMTKYESVAVPTYISVCVHVRVSGCIWVYVSVSGISIIFLLTDNYAQYFLLSLINDAFYI